MINWDEIEIELYKKLDPKRIKPAKNFGPKGDYLEGWDVIDTANRIFGFGEWGYTVDRLECVSDAARLIGKAQKDGFGVTYTCLVKVQAGSVTRQDVGSGHGYDVDRGLAHESASKEAVTDALKRALRTFGNQFGLPLYDKTRENVGEEKLSPVDQAIMEIKQPDLKTALAAMRDIKNNRKAVFCLPEVPSAMIVRLRAEVPGMALNTILWVEENILTDAMSQNLSEVITARKSDLDKSSEAA